MLEITFAVHKIEEKVFDWVEDLAAELEREHFRSLTEVVCHFGVYLLKKDLFMSKQYIVEMIEGKLPKLASRRPPILRVDVTVHADPGTLSHRFHNLRAKIRSLADEY